MKNCYFFTLFLFLFAGCSNRLEAPAPIEYKASDQYTQNVLSNINNTLTTEESRDHEEQDFIYHEVMFGETIEDISKQYKQSVSTIAKANDLETPYHLEEFQIVRIPISHNDSSKSSSVATEVKIHAPKFIPPVEGKLISKFGEASIYGKNQGINISAKAGTKVVSTADGKVVYIGYDGTFGNLVLIKLESENVVASYAHLQNDILPIKGQFIRQGDVIGYVGNTGKVKTPQLYFSMREGTQAKDPLKYINL